MTETEYMYNMGPYELEQKQENSSSGSLLSWLVKPSCIILLLFTFGTMVLSGKGQQQALGVLLVLAFSFASVMQFKIIFPIPPEIKMFVAWVIWASITGPIVAEDTFTLWHGGLRQVLQVMILVIAVYGIARIHTDSALKAAMLGVIIGGILQAVITKGAVQQLGGSLARLDDETERIQGLAQNANTLGFVMIWSLLAVFMFWKQKRGKTHKVVLIASVSFLPFLCYGLLASGSRKSLVTFAFVIAIWLWYAMAPRKKLKAFTWKIGVIVAVIAVSGPTSVYVLNNTLAGKRMMNRLSRGADIVTAERARYEMYIEGLEMTAKNPFFGVGVNQYKEHSKFGKYSHSNYMEPLATTGFLGFILYQGIFFIPLIRAWKLTKTINDARQVYQLKLIVISCIAFLLLGLGTPFYTSTSVMTFLALISGYTYSLSHQVDQELNYYESQLELIAE